MNKPKFEIALWKPTSEIVNLLEQKLGDRVNAFNLLKNENLLRFKVGLCFGLYERNDIEYKIIAVFNKNAGNGDFEHTMKYFEDACKRDKKALRFCELWNKDLKKHLINKRGFTKKGSDDLIKYFK